MIFFSPSPSKKSSKLEMCQLYWTLECLMPAGRGGEIQLGNVVVPGVAHFDGLEVDVCDLDGVCRSGSGGCENVVHATTKVWCVVPDAARAIEVDESRGLSAIDCTLNSRVLSDLVKM